MGTLIKTVFVLLAPSEPVIGSSIPDFFIVDTSSLKIAREVPIPVQGVGNVQVVDPSFY